MKPKKNMSGVVSKVSSLSSVAMSRVLKNMVNHLKQLFSQVIVPEYFQFVYIFVWDFSYEVPEKKTK